MRPKTLQNLSPTFELDPVPLSIVKTDRFDPLETIQGPGETGGRILSARKEDQGARVLVHGGVILMGPAYSLQILKFLQGIGIHKGAGILEHDDGMGLLLDPALYLTGPRLEIPRKTLKQGRPQQAEHRLRLN